MVIWDLLGAWPALVMGWPPVVLGLLLYAAALVLRRPWLGLAAVVVWTPFCLYISLYPMIRGLGLVALAGNALSVVALWRHRTILACVSLIPFVLVAGYLATTVFLQAAAGV